MKEYILDNGIKLIYIKGTSDLTSISIALNAGAAQDGEILGVAHAVEHMIYKGTENRTEAEINELSSKIFGFTNAMTNYPYVVFYGTSLKEDFEKGVELFSDILINPVFSIEGFNEEMDVIKQELKEWDEELDQFCEDKLLFNSQNNRLKYPIIGTAEDLNKIKLEDLKDFYKRYYSPKNMTIAISSSFQAEEVIRIVNKYFKNMKCENDVILHEECYKDINFGVFKDRRDGVKSSRVQINFDISDLSEKEIKALRIFNEYFGEGVNSLLFDKLRTKSGLVYDVLTTISYESYIKLYKIMFTTSKDKVKEALKEVDKSIDEIKILSDSKIEELIKSIRIKKLFKEEQSIRYTNLVATYGVMFKDAMAYDKAYRDFNDITGKFIYDTAKKVLDKKYIEIIS